MSWDDYYPPGTWAGDPRAPWNGAADDEGQDEPEGEATEDDEEDGE